jgi:choline kinase
MAEPIPAPAQVAVILVAGVGQRLRPLTDDRPKALVEVGGQTILGRATRALATHGVAEIVLATGYREDAVERAMADCPVPVRLCPNLAYDTTQNSVSLLACRRAVAGRGFYKLDGDLVFDAEVLARLDRAGADLAVAVDSSVALGSEEMKVAVRSGSTTITAFGKNLVPRACHGESIGVERVASGAAERVFAALAAAVAAGETQLYYEDVYARLLARSLRAEAVEVGDLRWIEIDTAEDLSRARRLFAEPSG